MLTLIHFYPRSPCGERPVKLFRQNYECFISIHALLAESDLTSVVSSAGTTGISIHALLAESDGSLIMIGGFGADFYPRSPCGERLRVLECTYNAHVGFLSTLSLRRATISALWMALNRPYFYPRSPCGERPGKGQSSGAGISISIHALLAESDTRTQSQSLFA